MALTLRANNNGKPITFSQMDANFETNYRNARVWSGWTSDFTTEPFEDKDIVYYNGKFYVAIQDGTNQPPDSSPAYWQEMTLSVTGTTSNPLTDGDGIVDFTYDGSTGGVTVAIDADPNFTFTGGQLSLDPTITGLTSVTATTFLGDLNGNASTSTAFQSPHNVTLNGDVTGSTTYTSNIAITTTIPDSSVTNNQLVNDTITVNAGDGLTTTSAGIALGGSATINVMATTNGGLKVNSDDIELEIQTLTETSNIANTDWIAISDASATFADRKISYQNFLNGITQLTAGEGININGSNEIEIKNATTFTDGILVYWNNTTNQFEDAQMEFQSGGGHIGIDNNLTVGGDLGVVGNLYVSGTTTTIETETLVVEDNIITLNASPSTENYGGIEVTDITNPKLTNGYMVWHGTNDYWMIGASTGNTTGSTNTILGDLEQVASWETPYGATLAGSVAYHDSDGSLLLNAGLVFNGSNTLTVANLAGNASTASALSPGFTITIDGDISGTTETYGTGNVTITSVITDGSVTNGMLEHDAIDLAVTNGLEFTAGNDSIILGESGTTIGIADTTVTANTYGAADTVPVFTVNSRGQLTSVTDTAISILHSAVSDWDTEVENTVFQVGNFVDGTSVDFTVTAGASVTAEVNLSSTTLFTAASPSKTIGLIDTSISGGDVLDIYQKNEPRELTTSPYTLDVSDLNKEPNLVVNDSGETHFVININNTPTHFRDITVHVKQLAGASSGNSYCELSFAYDVTGVNFLGGSTARKIYIQEGETIVFGVQPDASGYYVKSAYLQLFTMENGGLDQIPETGY